LRRAARRREDRERQLTVLFTVGGGLVFDSVHHVQLAMPRGEEATAPAFFVDVLGMAEIDKLSVLAARGGVWFRRTWAPTFGGDSLCLRRHPNSGK
jgi:hypothetical protein